jgi:hypothetical protein
MRIFLIVLFGFFSESVLAETALVDPTQDNTLYESTQGALSNGAGEFLFTGSTVSNGVRRTVIAFKDLSAVPEGAKIESVRKEDSPATTVRLFRLEADWGEGSSDAPGQEGGGTSATTGDATWDHRFFDNMTWNSPGGDFANSESAQFVAGSFGAHMVESTAALVADVQGWLDNPGGNFGWILIAGEDVKSARRFNSRENSNAERRPMLEIEYTMGTTPDPGDFSGPWFDPTLDGEGYLIYKTPVGWLIYYFGYSADGQRLWLVSNLVDIESLVFGQTYEFSMLVGEPGSFELPTPSSALTSWGILQILLTDCVTGVFTLDGVDGVKVSNVVKVIGVEGASCTDD